MRKIQDEEALARRDRRVGEWCSAVSEGRGTTGIEEGRVTRMRLRLASEEDPMVLLIVQAEGTGGKYIAFVGAPDIGAAILAWRSRDGGKGLKWKEDVPWSERGG